MSHDGTTPEQTLALLLRMLKLPSFAASYEQTAHQAERGGWTFSQYLRQLCESEVADRRERRIDRLLKLSELPADKTLANLDITKLPAPIARQLPILCDGSVVRRGDNILAFGLPGRGKTHLVCAIGHELVRRGHPVLFTPTYLLVQRLLAAKRDLALERQLKKLDQFDAVILDDIGYVQQDRDEMEVLFTFLAQRYERRSVMITSNLVFSQWDRIFKDPMTTAAAIDRLVHHSVILDMTGPSIRGQEAKARKGAPTKNTKTKSRTEPTQTQP